MTLWIDVTDLYHWGLGHLTGIQRTSASVLSELMAVRGDVQLFAYDPAAKVLRKIDAHALPAVVRRYIGARTEAGRGSGNLAEAGGPAA
ncbi:MAG TPA: glycosyltransferase family 1 protein, partial [Afipia sp.]|nr:glycosyltransferase family 1 protein [Afipia sp.]